MSLELHFVSPDDKVKLVSATKIIRSMKGQFNNLKTTQDRKYLIYTIFGFARKEFGYTVEKFVGSNQVILTKSEPDWTKSEPWNAKPTELVLYDSDNEGELSDPAKFEQFVLKHLRKILKEVKECPKTKPLKSKST